MEKIIIKDILIKAIEDMVDYIETYKNFSYQQLLVKIPKEGPADFHEHGYSSRVIYVEGYKDHPWALDTFISSPDKDLQIVVIICDKNDLDFYLQLKNYGIISLSGKPMEEIIQTIRDLTWFD